MLELIECHSDKLDDLIRISRDTFITAFAKDNNPDDFKSYIDSAFSEKTLLKELGNMDSQFYFLTSHGETLGYLKLNWGSAQSDIKDPLAIELERIYVYQTRQGKGLGRWMLNWVKQKAANQHMVYIWLGVWQENKEAIRFYEREGFVRFGTHPYYIGNDEQTDWLLRFNLKKV